MRRTNRKPEVIPTYEGWTNKPTWLVNLWLTNEESANDELERIVKRHRSLYDRTHELKDWVEEMMPTTGMDADLISWALALRGLGGNH